MHTPSLLLAATLLLGLVSSDPAGDETPGHAAAAVAPEGPNAHPPHGLPLTVHEDAWLRAPGDWWFEARAAEEPGRFEYVEELVDADGEKLGGWRDSRGEFELRYDAEEDEAVYWQHLSAELLTRGRRDFVQYCASCHGFEGDGYGRSGMALRPPPRNFTEPSFKFSKVPGEFLPTDAALAALVRRGLAGTAMLPWAVSDEQLHEILQYIKSLSPEGRGWRDVYSEIRGPVEVGDDPWLTDVAAGVARGEEVYHGLAKCNSCHPSYVSVARLAELSGAGADFQPRPDFTYPVAKATDSYTVLGHPMLLLPPDFTWNDVRAGIAPSELFQTIGSGIGGTAMPRWKGSLEDKDIWAMAHYVRSVIDRFKGKPVERAAFMAGLRKGS